MSPWDAPEPAALLKRSQEGAPARTATRSVPPVDESQLDAPLPVAHLRRAGLLDERPVRVIRDSEPPRLAVATPPAAPVSRGPVPRPEEIVLADVIRDSAPPVLRREDPRPPVLPGLDSTLEPARERIAEPVGFDPADPLVDEVHLAELTRTRLDVEPFWLFVLGAVLLALGGATIAMGSWASGAAPAQASITEVAPAVAPVRVEPAQVAPPVTAQPTAPPPLEVAPAIAPTPSRPKAQRKPVPPTEPTRTVAPEPAPVEEPVIWGPIE